MSAAGLSISTPPPALTWLHLLPSGSKLCGEGLPNWLGDRLDTHCAEGDGAIRVAWKTPADVRAGSNGIVSINSSEPSRKDFEHAGLGYVRRFAAIPNLQEARWLIPLDSPAISSAAFSLYTPARASARFKRWAVRMATHTRLPIWYRDQITIALPQMPPLERAISALFPGRDVRLALSSGAPEGARNRKASALVIDADGKLLAFAKLARSQIARQILANEAEVLPRLAHLPAPRLLMDAEIDGTRVLAQTPLPGRPAPLTLGAAHREFLHSLQSQETMPAGASGMVAGLAGRLTAWPDLLDIFHSTLPTLASFSVPLTIVHGDFAPWNLRLHNGRISAFDWEYAELSGLPLIDEIHYGLQVGMMLESWSVSRALRFLNELAQVRPMGLEPAHVRAITTVYLLDTLARLLGEGYDGAHDMIVWHRGLLDLQPSAATARGGRGVAA